MHLATKLLFLIDSFSIKDYYYDMKNRVENVLNTILNSRHAITLTGAGISTLCGIPDFRSPHSGLWYRYDAEKIFLIDHFYSNPEYFYNFSREFIFKGMDTDPGIIHHLVAVLQEKKLLKRVITQNIDLLHQKAGSTDVLELHGSPMKNYCVGCRAIYSFEDVKAKLETEKVPRCDNCDGLIKPDIIFFGECLHENVISTAMREAQQADCCIVLGSSLIVYPAASIPQITLENGGKLIIVNKDRTPFDNYADQLLNMDLQEFGELALNIMIDKKLIEENEGYHPRK